jgi:hypothetical protein
MQAISRKRLREKVLEILKAHYGEQAPEFQIEGQGADWFVTGALSPKVRVEISQKLKQHYTIAPDEPLVNFADPSS